MQGLSMLTLSRKQWKEWSRATLMKFLNRAERNFPSTSRFLPVSVPRPRRPTLKDRSSYAAKLAYRSGGNAQSIIEETDGNRNAGQRQLRSDDERQSDGG